MSFVLLLAKRQINENYPLVGKRPAQTKSLVVAEQATKTSEILVLLRFFFFRFLGSIQQGC